jgi:DNA-binding response OmpR family regulator
VLEDKSASAAVVLSGLRVMVVEDEPLISMMIEETLLDSGCVVVGPFSDVPGALAATRTEAFDAAVLDVNLAGVRVYPVAEAISARSIPVLLLSGYGQDAVPDSHPEWTACAKPFRGHELINALVDQVEKHRSVS